MTMMVRRRTNNSTNSDFQYNENITYIRRNKSNKGLEENFNWYVN